jgi:chromosome segregation ATPase
MNNIDTTFAADPRLAIGANNPPQTRADELALQYKDYIDRATEILRSAGAAPAKVSDDETHGSIAEVVKKTRDVRDELTTAFEAEKAPHNLAVTQLQGFFKTWIDKLEAVRKDLTARNAEYSTWKKAEEKKRIEAAAQKKREEQEKKDREARDAQQTKEAAQQALLEFQRLSQEADQAKASATSEVEQAQAQVAIAESKLAKVKADNSAIAAEFAKRLVDGNPETDENKASKRAECEGNLKAARADLEAARSLLSEARDKAKAAKDAARKAEEEEAAKLSQVRTAEREERSAAKEAESHGKAAERLERIVEKDDASLGSTRSIHGAVSTTTKIWKHSVTDVKLLDKEALWHLIDFKVIEVAVGKWGDLQPPEHKKMPGATFWQETVGVIR